MLKSPSTVMELAYLGITELEIREELAPRITILADPVHLKKNIL